jgi:hypothetical protein
MRWKKYVAGMRERETRYEHNISVRKAERKEEAAKWSRLS